MQVGKLNNTDSDNLLLSAPLPKNGRVSQKWQDRIRNSLSSICKFIKSQYLMIFPNSLRFLTLTLTLTQSDFSLNSLYFSSERINSKLAPVVFSFQMVTYAKLVTSSIYTGNWSGFWHWFTSRELYQVSAIWWYVSLLLTVYGIFVMILSLLWS